MKNILYKFFTTGLIVFTIVNCNAQLSQIRSWTKNGSTSFNQTSGCGNCLGMLWSAPSEIFADHQQDEGISSPPLNAAYAVLSAYNSCLSSSNCYYTRGIIIKDFQYSFPTNVTITITGIQVKVFGLADTANTIKDYAVKLIYNNAAVGTNKKKGTFWPTTYTQNTYGSSTDLWGTNWTPAMISDPGFGVMVKVQNMDVSSSRRFILDWVYVIIYYTVSP